MRAPHRSCARVAPQQVGSIRMAPPQVRREPPLVPHRAHGDAGVRSGHAQSACDGRVLVDPRARHRRWCRHVTRVAPSRIRSRHQAQRFAPHMGVHRARAPRDRALPATLHHRADRDRMARDSSTTPRVRRDVVVAARVQVVLAHHSRQLRVHQQLRMLSALVQEESQPVAAHLRRVDAAPPLVLF